MFDAGCFDSNENTHETLTLPKLKRLIYEYLKKRKNITEIEIIPDEVVTDWEEQFAVNLVSN